MNAASCLAALPCAMVIGDMPDPHIRARDLSKRYRSGETELVVFSGVDLAVGHGEMLALVGESGAGGTTTPAR